MQKRILVIGEPSVDHIFTLSPKAKRFMAMEEGMWELTPESYFCFIMEREGRKMIGKIEVGKKWPGKTLMLAEKNTLTKHDADLFSAVPFDKGKWDMMLRDRHAIPAEEHIRQMGGPAKNTIETVAKIDSDLLAIPQTQFTCLFLGGFDPATQAYMETMKGIGSASSRMTTAWLLDEMWATHEAFSFVLPKAFRTLIRYQGNRRSFDPLLVHEWFKENREETLRQDAVLISSLKNIDLICECATFLREYHGKVIVAPTNDMLQKAPEETRDIIHGADILICNLEEICVLLREKYHNRITPREQEILVRKALLDFDLGRIYVSNGPEDSWTGEKEIDGRIRLTRCSVEKVPCASNVNAGDIWSGAILAQELQGHQENTQILRWANAYTGFRLLGTPVSLMVEETV